MFKFRLIISRQTWTRCHSVTHLLNAFGSCGDEHSENFKDTSNCGLHPRITGTRSDQYDLFSARVHVEQTTGWSAASDVDAATAGERSASCYEPDHNVSDVDVD